MPVRVILPGSRLQQEVEDEVLYVLKIIRKDQAHRVRDHLMHLEGNNDDIRDEDHADDRHPLIEKCHVPEEKYRCDKTGR